jgi:predicted nucleic acid-binding protein
MPKGKRRELMPSTVEAMFEEDFGNRILPFDSDAARVFAEIASSRRRSGRPISQWDAQIAAIARSRGASLATRNTGDFEHCGITLVSPWSK